MTAREVFELRKNGLTEEAYEAARKLYSYDKSPYASSAMFWTAVDIFKKRIDEERTEEASKILLALKRLLPNVPDRSLTTATEEKHEGWVRAAYDRCELLLQKKQNKNNGYKETSQHIQMGFWGEAVAADYLRHKGYVILEQDWHSGHRDIDIIAQHNGIIVFIEVKTRQNTMFGVPEDAIDWKKRRNLLHAVTHYMNYRKINSPVRFDIITIVGPLGCKDPAINHIEDVDIMR